MMITKKHKVVLWDRNDSPYILTGEELYEKIRELTRQMNVQVTSAVWKEYAEKNNLPVNL
jgi:hypothetical protein